MATNSMNAAEAFTRAALYQECIKSDIIKNINVGSASNETIRELLNINNNMTIRKMPIILSKYITKMALSFAKNRFPNVKMMELINPENIVVDVEGDEMHYLLNSSSRGMAPNIVLLVTKNIVCSLIGSTINDFKNSLTGQNQQQTNKDDDSHREMTKIEIESHKSVWGPVDSPKEFTDTFNDRPQSLASPQHQRSPSTTPILPAENGNETTTKYRQRKRSLGDGKDSEVEVEFYDNNTDKQCDYSYKDDGGDDGDNHENVSIHSDMSNYDDDMNNSRAFAKRKHDGSRKVIILENVRLDGDININSATATAHNVETQMHRKELTPIPSPPPPLPQQQQQQPQKEETKSIPVRNVQLSQLRDGSVDFFELISDPVKGLDGDGFNTVLSPTSQTVIPRQNSPFNMHKMQTDLSDTGELIHLIDDENEINNSDLAKISDDDNYSVKLISSIDGDDDGNSIGYDDHDDDEADEMEITDFDEGNTRIGGRHRRRGGGSGGSGGGGGVSVGGYYDDDNDEISL